MRRTVGCFLTWLVASGVSVSSQTSGPTYIIPGSSKIVWDQPADASTPPSTVGTYIYRLVIDPHTSTPTRAVLTAACSRPLDPPGAPFACSAVLPSIPEIVGIRKLGLEVENTVGKVSSAEVLDSTTTAPTTPPPPDPCLFPTGASAISLFPTRMLHGGPRTNVQFQIGSPGSPITHLTVEITTDAGFRGQVASLVGSNLTDVGSIWFTRPATPGVYKVWVRAQNAALCGAVVNTKFVFVVQ